MKEETQLTAVEWLANILDQSGYLTKEDFDGLVKQAKEMQEKQKIEAQLEILNLLQKELDGNNTEENNLWHKINRLKKTFKQ